MVTWTRHEGIWDEAAAASYDTPGTGIFASGELRHAPFTAASSSHVSVYRLAGK